MNVIKKKKKKRKKKCKHPVDKVHGDFCSACGFVEGVCDSCGKIVMGYCGDTKYLEDK